MDVETEVARHYGRAGLAAAIDAALAAGGRGGAAPTADELAPLDEFHIGGRQATVDFLPALPIRAGQHLLDIGSGLGGPSRFIASATGCTVSGIDLTPDYVAAATDLAARLGMAGRVDYRVASALALPFADASFDGATLFHVGMNIADKARLAAEVRRVLRPGGFFGIYDVMREDDGPLDFPVPWATEASASFVETAAEYRRVLEAAGFAIRHERSRREVARAFFAAMRARNAQAGGPPPIGLHVVMGPTAPQKVGNMTAMVERGLISPTEMVGVAGR